MANISEIYIERYKNQNKYCSLIQIKNTYIYEYLIDTIKNLSKELGIIYFVIPNKNGFTSTFIKLYSLDKNHINYLCFTIMIKYYSYNPIPCGCSSVNTNKTCPYCYKIKKYTNKRRPLIKLFF